MSEALLLAIITPIAGTISALILKVWESIAKSKQRSVDAAKAEKEECRSEVASANERASKAEDSAEKWKMDYMELYNQFYFLRLAHAQATQDPSHMNSVGLGVAPHERRDSLSHLDRGD